MRKPVRRIAVGVAVWLAVSALGCVVHSTLELGERYTTLEIKLNYLRAMTRDTGPVRAIGTVIHAGRTTALAEARLEDATGKLLAHATSTCMILRPEARG